MKKSLLKPVAVLLCFGFLLMAVPSLNAAEKKTAKLNLKLAITQSVTSLFPWLAALIGSGSKTKGAAILPFGGIVKPTGDAPIIKPGSGD
jgi:LytS/YehU family sensor histidine kinase